MRVLRPDRIHRGEEILVFDIGGTTVRAGAYSPTGDAVTRSLRVPTPSVHRLGLPPGPSLRARLYTAMGKMGAELFPKGAPATVSVGFPGPVDQAGRVAAAPTVWGNDPTLPPDEVRDTLASLWSQSGVYLLNDVTAAGQRYLHSSVDDVCVVTVSTGIGHKVFSGGRVLTGPSGRGGEIGHWRVCAAPGAPLCACGGRGHLGAMASGTATVHHVSRAALADPVAFQASALRLALEGGEVDNEAFVAAYHAGDLLADRIVADMAGMLGSAVAALHLGTGVERFVLIGGFALALGDRYREAVEQAGAAGSWQGGTENLIRVEGGLSDDDSGLIGAGRYAAARESDRILTWGHGAVSSAEAAL